MDKATLCGEANGSSSDDTAERLVRRLVFQFDPEPLVFHSRYLEVVPDARLVWTNEEVFGSGQVTTATFEEQAGETRVAVRELYPSKDALDAAIAAGSSSGDMQETFDQLKALLPTLSS